MKPEHVLQQASAMGLDRLVRSLLPSPTFPSLPPWLFCAACILVAACLIFALSDLCGAWSVRCFIFVFHLCIVDLVASCSS